MFYAWLTSESTVRYLCLTWIQVCVWGSPVTVMHSHRNIHVQATLPRTLHRHWIDFGVRLSHLGSQRFDLFNWISTEFICLIMWNHNLKGTDLFFKFITLLDNNRITCNHINCHGLLLSYDNVVTFRTCLSSVFSVSDHDWLNAHALVMPVVYLSITNRGSTLACNMWSF